MAVRKIINEYYDKVDPMDMINDAERRIRKKKEAIKDMQNEYNLLEKQALSLYKDNIEYYTLDYHILKMASKWLCMIKENKDNDGNKLDHRKKYEEKNSFNYLYNKLKQYLGIEDFEIIEILEYGFYGTAMEVEFTYKNHTWRLRIPVPSRVTLKGYQLHGAYAFKLAISHKDTEYSSSVVDCTYEEDELENIMKNAINKYCLGD